MENPIDDYLKGIVESILFVSDKPVTLEQVKDAAETASLADVRRCISELQDEYENGRRGVMIMEIAGGYQMFSNPAYATQIRNFFKTRVKEQLSRPALETLAIIAYKQPVSRADIEVIRGVNSDGVVMHLLDKGLIKISGRKDVPGRPYIYSTTKVFLEYFGLKTLKDLPKLEDFAVLKTSDGGLNPAADEPNDLQVPQSQSDEAELQMADSQMDDPGMTETDPTTMPDEILPSSIEVARDRWVAGENSDDPEPETDSESSKDPIQLKQAMQEISQKEGIS